MRELSADQARRIAVRALGLAEPKPSGRVDARHVKRVIARLSLLQMDSVNVLVRAHYLPLFSRLGAYPTEILDRLAYRRRELFEYWGHEASLLPVELQPLMRWRMQRGLESASYGGFAHWAAKNNGLVQEVLAQVRERGPLAASDLEDADARAGPWWGWNAGKQAMEFLFYTGHVTATARRHFERVYDLTERVIPARILAMPTPPIEDAHAALIERAARALGVATTADLGDYFRLKPADARVAVARLADEGRLERARVDGWRQDAYIHPEATVPRRTDVAALVSPFDPVMWERKRAERLFGFHFRIEIYTPAPKRVYGYYVLPFLLGDRFVARVDLKADRKAGSLLVHAAFAEEGADARAIAGPLAAELRRMAGWLGLERVKVGRRGDLAAVLGRARP